MKTRLIFIFAFLLAATLANAQITIKGVVKDQKGETLPGANVYLKDTFDGANSSLDGSFSFETEETGDQILVVSFVGFKTLEKAINVSGQEVVVDVTLQEIINKIDGVTISAGAYEASDIKKVTVLKPLDIVSTASAAGDIMGAINTLPGTATVGESGRLFVRGGEGYETKVFIDGMEVRNAFGATAPNVPTRGRFSPFLFKGTVFSTGAYSAEYGQALSSALVLNSNDLPTQTQGDISIMSVGGDLAHTKKWEKASISAKIQYTDLRPYQDLVRQNFDWQQAPKGMVGEIVFRQKLTTNGLLKVYANADISDFIIRQPNISRGGEKDTIGVDNTYYYLNATYKDILNDKWTFKGGVSATSNQVDLGFNQSRIDDIEKGYHGKATLTWDASERVSVNMGGEYFHKNFSRTIQDDTNFSIDFSEGIAATYIESDYFASNKFVFRTGLRFETNTLLNRSWISPRIGAAYKISEKGQFSLGYGKFTQSAQNEYSLVNRSLLPETATHYILNYQYINNDRVFRIEAYKKQYNNLVKFDDPNDFTRENYTNDGFGEANGVDFFWRDNRTFKNTDYWISYSYVDSERDYQNFNGVASPGFISKHNFSWVIKHFINPIRTQVGATYTYASSRPFHNLNLEGFHNDGTPDFHDLSLNAAVLIKQNIILYMSSSNVFGRDNIFGYEYADAPNQDGFYERQAIRQGAKRFIFVGLFITLTKDGQENQLRNL